MSDSPEVPPLVVPNAQAAIGALRELGLRVSTARRMLLEALFDADGPVSAQWLSRELRLEESSVYRNLELFEQHGLIRHLHLGHGPGLYVLTGRAEVEYLFCPVCAKVTAVSPAELDPVREQIRTRFGHTPRFSHFAIVGLCADCAADADRGERSVTTAVAHSHGDYVHAHPDAGATHRH